MCTNKIISNNLSVEIGSILVWLTMFTIINVAQAFSMPFVFLLGTKGDFQGMPLTHQILIRIRKNVEEILLGCCLYVPTNYFYLKCLVCA